MDPHEVLSYPLMGEKATMMREAGNKLTFIVADKATKAQIRGACEQLYSVKVTGVTVMRTPEGKKKAHIKLSPEHSANEIASHFGVL